MRKWIRNLFFLFIFLILIVSSIQVYAIDYELVKYEDFSNGMPDDSILLEKPVIRDSDYCDGHELCIRPIQESNHWIVKDSKLFVTDFLNKSSGGLIYLFNDKIWSPDDNYTVSATMYRDFAYGVDMLGLIVGANVSIDTFYFFATSNTQGWFAKQEPGFGTSYCHSNCFDFSDIDLDKPHKLQINVNSNRITLIVNNIIVKELDIKIPKGYVGLYVWDSAGKLDPEFNGSSWFDDVYIYKQPILKVIEPENNIIVKKEEITDFTIEIEETDTKIDNVSLIFYEEIEYKDKYDEIKINRTIIDEVIKDVNITNKQPTNITIEYQPKEAGKFKWFWKVVDFLNNIFKTEDRNIEIK